MMKKIGFISILLSVIVLNINAQSKPSLSAIVGASNAASLTQNGRLYNEDSGAFVQFVQAGPLRERMQSYINELDANFSLEFLYFVPNGTFASKSANDIAQALMNIQTLEQAYMIRNDKEQALFSKVEIVNNFTDRKKSSLDRSTITTPINQSLYVILRDARFGKIDYRVDYTINNDYATVSLLNFSKLSYLGRRIAESEGMRLSFMKQDVAEGTLFVGHITAKIHELDKAKDAIHLPSFFSRRVEGMKGWYFKQVYGLKVKQGIYPVAIERS